MSLPNVIITLGNGNLGGVVPTTDAVAGLLLTGAAVTDKLDLNKHYLLGSTKDIETLGITEDNNPLAYAEILDFYEQAGEGAELHLLLVPVATTMAEMCAILSSSPIHKLIDGSRGRVRIVGVNKIAPEAYTPDLSNEYDSDTIEAAAVLHQVAESYASKVKPFRALIGAPAWTGDTDSLEAPNTMSYNRVGFVAASCGVVGGSSIAAIGAALGRAAAIEVHQSLGRVKDGSVKPKGYFTDGSEMHEKYPEMAVLHDAGFIIFRDYSTKSGAYFNGGYMAAPATDDYSTLANGRVIDKAAVIAYNTYISEIKDNVVVDESGYLSVGVCKSFQSMIENAIRTQMGTQISSFSAYVDAKQNILSTKKLIVPTKIIPQGTLDEIEVLLAFSNPAI